MYLYVRSDSFESFGFVCLSQVCLSPEQVSERSAIGSQIETDGTNSIE